jgi:hypothetical protein
MRKAIAACIVERFAHDMGRVDARIEGAARRAADAAVDSLRSTQFIGLAQRERANRRGGSVGASV